MCAMSATGLDAFDRTIQTTNSWLSEISDELGPDRDIAWHALGAVLHVLRDRLPLDQTVHLAAQLPLLVRGLYYEQWRPAGKPEKFRSREEFVAHVAEGLKEFRTLGAEDATHAVLAMLGRCLDPGECEKVLQALPLDVRLLWPNQTVRPQKPTPAHPRAH